MAYGGWHQGTADGMYYYRGGSGHGAWPTWSEVQAASVTPSQAAGETPQPGEGSGATSGQANTEAGTGNAQWDWGNQSWGGSSWGQGAWRDGSWQWNWWQPQGNAKGDYSDPPTWGGWSSYRLWKKALIRWNQNTDVPVWRRFEKLSKQLGAL